MRPASKGVVQTNQKKHNLGKPGFEPPVTGFWCAEGKLSWTVLCGCNVLCFVVLFRIVQAVMFVICYEAEDMKV